jgi:signal transduction histidine kinase
MSGAAAWVGWLLAVAASTLWLLARLVHDNRMEAVARACHELRGPITAARLGVERALRGGPLSAGELRAIDAELGRATLALDDLAGARAGGAMQPEPAPVDLRRLLEELGEAWEATAQAAGAELRVSFAGTATLVRGDALRLRQAIGNLIANAIEHGGGVVEVRGSVGASAARVEITDAGRGLPAPVSRLASSARRGRGSRGRGLAIATAVAAAHGGRLAAAPCQRGARLVLELPRDSAPDGLAGAG